MTSIVVYSVTIFLFIAPAGSKFVLNHLNHSLQKDIVQLVERYLSVVHPLSSINVIIDGQTASNVYNTILSAYTLHPIILNDPSEKCIECYNRNSSMKTHYIVGIYKTPQHVEPFQWQVFYGNNWKPEAFIAIWITNPTSLDDIQALLARFWLYNSVNVIAIAHHYTENSTNVYSYDPFRVKNDGTRGEIFQVPEKSSLFPDKLKDLQGYPIPISLYHHQPHARLNHFNHTSDGMDVNYYRFLANSLNFTPVLKTAKVPFIDYVVNLPNNTKLSVVGDILINRSEMIGNSVYWEVLQWAHLHVLYPRWRSEIIVAVPKANPTPGIVLLLESNSGLTLMLIGIALTILLIFFIIRNDRNAFLRTLGLFLFQNSGKIGKPSSERLFILFWIYWAFLIVSIFQSQLIHDLSAPPFYHDIDSLQELGRSNLTLLTKRWEYKALNYSYVNEKKRLFNRAMIEINGSKCLMWLLQYRNVACTVDRSFADYTTSEIARAVYKREVGNKSKASWQIHFIEEPLIKFWKTYAVRKSFPYLRKIDEATSRLVEVGIREKWKNDDVSENFKILPTINKFEYLTLDNMDKVFMLLIYGHTVATGVFIIEVIYYHFKLHFTSWKIVNWSKKKKHEK